MDRPTMQEIREAVTAPSVYERAMLERVDESNEELRTIAAHAEKQAKLAEDAAKRAKKDALRARIEAAISLSIALASLLASALGLFPLL